MLAVGASIAFAHEMSVYLIINQNKYFYSLIRTHTEMISLTMEHFDFIKLYKDNSPDIPVRDFSNSFTIHFY